ncbi:MAG: tetratricopeptide repeat protein [Bacteroidia bacterium]
MKLFSLSFFLLLASFSYSQMPAQKVRYDSLIKQGLDNFHQKKLSEATAIFESAIQLDSTRPDGYYGLGVVKSTSCFYDSLNCQEAQTLLMKASSIQPGYKRVYYNLSICKSKTGDYQAELDYLNRAIEQDPGDSDYFHNRGMVKLRLGNKRGACEDFTKAAGMGNERSKHFVVDCK